MQQGRIFFEFQDKHAKPMEEDMTLLFRQDEMQTFVFGSDEIRVNGGGGGKGRVEEDKRQGKALTFADWDFLDAYRSV